MSLSRDPAKAREWQDRSRARAAAKPRVAPQDRKRKGLKARSPKREAAMVERRVLVRQMIHDHPYCQAGVLCGGRARSVDVHERLKRSRGGNILDPVQAHMMTVCRACHEFTEREVAESTRLRLLLPSWHQCPPVGPC